MNKYRLLVITFLAISLPVILFGLIGCMKKPDHMPEYGEEVPFSKVEEALDELGVADPFSIKQGEFSYIERTQVINNSAPFLTLQRGDTVTEKIETATQFQFKIVTEINEWIDGEMKSSKTESSATLDKPTTTVSMQNIKPVGPTPYSGYQRISLYDLKRLDEDPSTGKTTYHNLKKQALIVPLPDLVRRRPDCGGIADCTKSLRALEVTFDRVDWSKSPEGDRTSFKFIVSPDVPYFASQLVGCAQLFVEIESRIYPLLQCEEVRDFKFGSSP